MAESNDQIVLGTRTALANYSARAAQYTLVKSTSGSDFSQQVTAGGVVVGVLADRPTAGQPGLLVVGGVTPVRVNSTAHEIIACGDKLCASTAAGAIPSTLVTRYVIGRAMERLSSNSPDNAIITMLITHQGAGSSGAAASA